ncbi:high-potential iron-sulfur protein [bacterium]|nr:high-potential iron-sulfur protein [bacterium]
MNRRSFFQTALTAFGALTVLSIKANSEERRRGGGTAAATGLALVNPNDPAAKGVNYVHDLKDIKDVKLQTERTGVKFKDQHCKSCVFYLKDKETTVSGKKAAPCQMPFATGKAVAAEGWCTSWAKKS